MIYRLNKWLLSLLFCYLMLIGVAGGVLADEESDQLRDIESRIKEYQAKIEEAQSKQRTLASTIEVLNNQIYLTEARISMTTGEIMALENQIKDLSVKIDYLDQSLDKTSQVLNQRIAETYKRSFLPSMYLFLTSNTFTDLYSRVKYLQVVQKNDKEVMFKMEEDKLTYDIQKELKESKQQELEKLEAVLKDQTAQLGTQKASKQNLLVLTKNDEKQFQSLLSQARAEYEAIQAILARKGDESDVGEVKAGDRIASVIEGASCNSSGGHLHFTVADGNGNALNPFNYLKSIDYENCSGGGGCSEGDPFNPSGSWEWPVAPKIRFTQGFGTTWAVNNTWVGQIYRFHNGIDVTGGSNEVKAVADGKLFRGSYSGSRGCRLRYVRVEHKEGGLETYYLHVNY